MLFNKFFIFSNSYAPVLGGIQTVTGQIAVGLKKDYDVRVITHKYPMNLKRKEKIDEVTINRYYFGNFYTSLNSIKSIIIRLSSYILYTLNIFKLLLLFYREQPEIVNVHFPLHQIKYVLFLKRFFNFKIITSFHGHDVLRWLAENKKSSLYKDQIKLITISDEITACSNYLARVVESTYNLSSQIVKTVYNGTDLVKPNKNAALVNLPYVFAFGRLEYHKGFDLLIEAFSIIKHDNMQLIIAGSGSSEVDLKALVNNLKLQDQIKFIGRVGKSQIDSYTQNALCNVTPSRREPFGIVVIEAIASGRPVLATNVGGIPEILKKEYGILVEPDVEGLAKGLKKILNEFKSPSKKIVDNYVVQFSIEKMVENYKVLCC